MEQPSLHEIRLYRTILESNGEWLTSKELAKRSNVAPRTAREVAKKLADRNILDVLAVTPGYRYRLAKTASKANLRRMSDLIVACGIV